MANESPLEQFKQVLTGTARALAHEPEIELAFTADAPTQADKNFKVPMPGRLLPPDQVAEARGFADSFSLKLKHHNAARHAALRPSEVIAGAAFDAVENARVEALGSRNMAGIAANLGHALELKLRTDPISRAQSADEVPISTALSLIVRERLTGAPIPDAAVAGVDMLRGWIEEKAGSDLDALALALDDQGAFAALTQSMLEHLNLTEGDVDPSDADEGGDDAEDSQDQDGDSDDDGEGEAGQAEARAEPQQGEGEETEADYDGEDMDDQDGADGEMGDDGMQPVTPQRRNWDHLPQSDYKIWSTKYDETITATELADEEELNRLRAYLDQQLSNLQSVVTKLANRLQRRLMAQQNRSWDFDQEEGMIDAARLARIVVSPGSSLSYKIERETDFRDTVVTLLIDNSGSMRGRPISIAAISADILARTLERCGVKTEILGFTTRAWKGGQAREDWLAAGRQPMPGRLNDLRHIVYKKADEPWRHAKRNLGLMMREGLLKENIDGEALLWAHNRLIARAEDRRILMVISDGAPVDDSTLSVNHGGYLEQHLRKVIEMIETRSPVQLVAIGIGHDVTRYYKRAVTIMDVEQLGGTMIEQLAGLFDEE
ncbi:MAG: cobaltochelatase subunit CobT [Sphingomonadales bacterium 35-56-22]|jgi:cobaltochelatase CobT|uniref:cobaltochelatase subunit CobT n=1 Tax=Sphingorhabdus sp. TaxID=1902408 RepID=UPI000BC68250|nr:cobaltochelatase subunit CobT [Sphingorhabdus sp.]OYY16572.1 MAG: cobaltochelatase subunit CobT [Sphingomonadales bacterium 35-56-22]OYY98338.1 MAG: cobaltochelatase subunit CobT [Sphingomonadales bacterium 28-56-43]OYZ60810.1 MAG: cobaltochelatase subunit CobT [Sphingomonadales bacterium 24-56-14]OZA83640.1 MAG: cobaltochelatase subunit CobT [Sphingomonadales bacterium 39-57-19]HQS12003.1 cobaltochelatase subunit CobT [Sphingorhabdus sp.]